MSRTPVFALRVASAGLEARLLAGLRSPDEAAREAASEEMERLRVADHEGEPGPRSWPGEDEAEASRPKTFYERMKLRIFAASLESLAKSEETTRAAIEALGAVGPAAAAALPLLREYAQNRLFAAAATAAIARIEKR